jgi:hypothetical protein
MGAFTQLPKRWIVATISDKSTGELWIVESYDSRKEAEAHAKDISSHDSWKDTRVFDRNTLYANFYTHAGAR